MSLCRFLRLHTSVYDLISDCPEIPVRGSEAAEDVSVWREALRCLIQSATLSTYHLAGTCKMGASREDGSVTGTDLR
ncbi:unnamed protein product [Protopolystoma xenopodis]|uniref:Glucose-methanol-choline oxidoreductase C-terminal domain-containing protein n=1 Tax=Protopolystoma xenopodis TaxID=117903 RepID=A0A3S5BCS6_9PLAT|nr:unnamed protein product [Protopolystoma xenopodis]